MTSSSPHVRNAFLLLALEAAMVWLLHARSFEYPVAFSLVHLIGVVLLLASACVMKVRRQQALTRATQHSELLRQYLAEHAFGQDRMAELTCIVRCDAKLVGHCFLEVFSSLKGEGRTRLAELARSLGLHQRWQACMKSRNTEARHAGFVALSLIGSSFAESDILAYLNGADPDLRVKALQTLLRAGDRTIVERLFTLTLAQPLWVRMHLADSFRQYALLLSGKALPEALASRTPGEFEAAIAFLRSWKCIVALSGWESLLNDQEPFRFAELISILPFIASPEEGEHTILSALSHYDGRVRVSAARVAARWQLKSATELLGRLLQQPDFAVAYASAYALIHLGEAGKSILRQELLRAGLASTRVALEALEYSETQRVAWEVV